MQPGPRDADDTLRQLISVIDNREVYDAVQLLRAENPERSFARPALGGYAAERPCRAGQGAAKARYIIRLVPLVPSGQCVFGATSVLCPDGLCEFFGFAQFAFGLEPELFVPSSGSPVLFPDLPRPPPNAILARRRYSLCPPFEFSRQV